MKELYFAGGCFWGTEHFFKQINGVISTEVGYANSNVENPTYEQVCTGDTHAVETVKTIFDDALVSIPFLVDLFFKMIDPTVLNRQGGDSGTQYRTGIYYLDKTDYILIKDAVSKFAVDYKDPIMVEILPLKNFYSAEDYHQDYLDKNPSGYCHVSPALFELARRAKKS